MLNNEEGVTGKILTFDFNHHSSDVREIEIEGVTKPKHLNPLGLDIWEDKGETWKLCVMKLPCVLEKEGLKYTDKQGAV